MMSGDDKVNSNNSLSTFGGFIYYFYQISVQLLKSNYFYFVGDDLEANSQLTRVRDWKR